ncbi:hypothetical protein LPU83_pLPU83d_1065 (plasmid) [Rhizobium favelukesii]|uniref:Integrase catalytic domain-containing protein n=1 Tax=Rhizobium favelukesii TaxID=348824 RepID=W6RQM0_9HYPH|nr:hypothetical protein LPU83_pLPU83d_1065 [Rhizobium favelukesii]
MQNGDVESFNGRLRDEPLNERLFSDLDDARSGRSRLSIDAGTVPILPPSRLSCCVVQQFAGGSECSK